MPFFRNKNRENARARARVSARVKASNKAATTLVDNTTTTTAPVSSSMKSNMKSTAGGSIRQAASNTSSVRFSDIRNPDSDSDDEDSASDTSSVQEKQKQQEVAYPSNNLADSSHYDEMDDDAAAEVQTDSYSSSGRERGGRGQQQQREQHYTGDEIVDSLRAIYNIIDEANAVIQAYETHGGGDEQQQQHSSSSTGKIPTTVNIGGGSTCSISSPKSSGGWGRRNKKAQAAAAAQQEAAVAAQVARESQLFRTRHVAGKSKEEVFVWATQALMRELDLVMPAFLEKKYRIDVNTLTPEKAEELAENTEVETLMPVTAKFLRKIDAGAEGLENKEQERSGVNRVEDSSGGGGPCGMIETFQAKMGLSPKEAVPLSAAQLKLRQEIEDDDRSVIVLAADMAEEIMQSLTMPETNEIFEGQGQPAPAQFIRITN